MNGKSEDFIVVEPGRTPRVRGSRITVYDVMDYYTHGRAPSYIAEVLSLTDVEVRAAIAYIDANRAKVDAGYAKILERDAEGNPPEIVAMLAESRQKLFRLKATLDAQREARTAAGDKDAATARGC